MVLNKMQMHMYHKIVSFFMLNRIGNILYPSLRQYGSTTLHADYSTVLYSNRQPLPPVKVDGCRKMI